jgi:hypothetical protein
VDKRYIQQEDGGYNEALYPARPASRLLVPQCREHPPSSAIHP